MDIDRQRLAAVRTLEALGYEYTGDAFWVPPVTAPPPDHIRTNELCRELELWRAALAGCLQDTPESAELEVITRLLEKFEISRSSV